MKAKNLKNTYVDGINPSHHKEQLYRSYKVIAFNGRKIVEVVDLRLYYPNRVCYACIWTVGKSRQSGSASASGANGDLTSIAAQKAIEVAGYELSERIAGMGDEKIVEAVKALGKLLSDDPVYVVKAYA